MPNPNYEVFVERVDDLEEDPNEEGRPETEFAARPFKSIGNPENDQGATKRVETQ